MSSATSQRHAWAWEGSCHGCLSSNTPKWWLFSLSGTDVHHCWVWWVYEKNWSQAVRRAWINDLATKVFWPCMHEDLSSVSQGPCSKQRHAVRHGCILVKSGQIPAACWASRLTFLVNRRSMRNTFSKNMDESKLDHWEWSPASLCSCTHVDVLPTLSKNDHTSSLPTEGQWIYIDHGK